jgi:hypothetical protein
VLDAELLEETFVVVELLDVGLLVVELVVDLVGW